MPPKREPAPEPGVLCLEDARIAQRAVLEYRAARRLTNARWREGHADGFLAGAIWAAEMLGATVVHRPPRNPRESDAPADGMLDGA